jgi:hypothetical protein
VEPRQTTPLTLNRERSFIMPPYDPFRRLVESTRVRSGWKDAVQLGALIVGLMVVVLLHPTGADTMSDLFGTPDATAAEFPAEGAGEEVEGFNNASASGWNMFRGPMVAITVLLLLIGGIAGALLAANRGAGARAGVGVAVAIAALVAYSPAIAISLLDISGAASAPLSGRLQAACVQIALLDPITLSVLIGAWRWRRA